MKTRTLFCALVAAMMIFVGCDKDEPTTPEPINPTNDPSVTPKEIVFESEAATQSVTVGLGTYSYYGAVVDEDGQGWCSVQDKENGIIDVIVTANTGALRTCYVNCWVANVEEPADDEKVLLPITVTQDAYKIEATEATFERFNFETEAHTDLIWDYDGGGHMEFGEMVYWWHRDWDEMYVTHTHDTLTFWARDINENAPNGDLNYDHEYNISIMITGFAEPFNNCEVNTVTYHHTWNGRNPDPNGNWQTNVGEDKVILAHIPLVDHNINIGNKTGRLYFEYKNEDMQVVEAYNLSHSDTKDGHYQERNHQYVGSTRDIGLVEVKFNLK